MIKHCNKTVKTLLKYLRRKETVPLCIGYSMTAFCNKTMLLKSIKIKEPALNTFIKGKTQYHPMVMITYT